LEGAVRARLGNARPRWLLLLAGVAILPQSVLLAVNILDDWTHDATSHNLFLLSF
jgi:hypothetical protein